MNNRLINSFNLCFNILKTYINFSLCVVNKKNFQKRFMGIFGLKNKSVKIVRRKNLVALVSNGAFSVFVFHKQNESLQSNTFNIGSVLFEDVNLSNCQKGMSLIQVLLTYDIEVDFGF